MGMVLGIMVAGAGEILGVGIVPMVAVGDTIFRQVEFVVVGLDKVDINRLMLVVDIVVLMEALQAVKEGSMVTVKKILEQETAAL